MNLFGINIIGLSHGTHVFNYELNEDFFKQYGANEIKKGNLRATVDLKKHETFIECFLNVKGTIEATCDRSLESFDLPITVDQLVVYKFGNEDKEVSENVQMISRDTATLDIGQPLYEYVLLAIPLKKIHPRFQDEETEEETTLIYSTESEEKEQEEKPIDPRWEKLKKLK